MNLSSNLSNVQKIIIGGLIVLILAFLVLNIKKGTQNTENNQESTATTTTTSTKSGLAIGSTGGGYTVEQVSFDNKSTVSVPDLNRLVFSSSINLSSEEKTKIESKIRSLQTTLKQNNKDFNSWIELGTYQKYAGDYDGAIISWKYVSKIYPGDYISLSNLGNLYAFFLKDNAMAEVYFKDAIARSPKMVYLYVQLCELYKNVFGNKEKALDLVSQGLKEIPNDPTLLDLKAKLSSNG